MDRWTAILKVPLNNNTTTSTTHHYRISASLCQVPATSVIFFNGDRVQGSGNPVIERLSDLKTLAEILVSKFGGGSVNVWVIEASFFNEPFDVYKDFIPSVNRFGEPNSYSPIGFPASLATLPILSNCLEEAKNVISLRQKEPFSIVSSSPHPKTILLEFSKGGTVLNQFLTEPSLTTFSTFNTNSPAELEPPSVVGICRGQETQIVPRDKESLLNSITEVHYVDVGLNSTSAYLTDRNVIERLCKRPARIRFVLHGTPMQWCDSRRAWIREEKNRLIHLLQTEAQRSGGKLQVCERFYFANREPNMQMHLEIIEYLDVS